MIVIHHLGLSQSERIVWLLEELDLPYELKLYARDPVSRLAPAAYKSLHPMGTAPVITDGDLVLGESGAIVEYIIAKYGDGRLALTASDPDFAQYLFWFHFVNATLLPGEMFGMLAAIAGMAEHPMMGFMRQRSDRAFALVEQRLGSVPYLAGEAFTAADIMTVFGLTTMRAFAPRDLSSMPNILSYLQRIGAREGYRQAMTKGDPGLTPMLV